MTEMQYPEHQPRHYTGFSEALVEDATVDIMKGIGWCYEDPFSISPDGTYPLRASYGEVVLEDAQTQTEPV